MNVMERIKKEYPEVGLKLESELELQDMEREIELENLSILDDTIEYLPELIEIDIAEDIF